MRSRLNNESAALVMLVLIEILYRLLSDELTVRGAAPAQQILRRAPIYYMLAGLILIGLAVCFTFWLLHRSRALRVAIFSVNSLFTIELGLAATLLILRLSQGVSVAARQLLADAVTLFVINILIFSLWYWYIETGNTRFLREVDGPKWDFLFPQRQGDLPGYVEWRPRFADYLFVAYTTSVAFSPTDTLPLSKSAKLLMMTQSIIALVIIVAVVGTAINMLAGGG